MAGNSNSRPADANAAWSLLASIGTTGPAGATGPAGTLDTGAERLTDGNPYLNLYAGNNSSGGIHVLRNDANSWGYFFGDNGGVGVLNGAGQWAIQSNGPVNATNTAVTLSSEGAARAVFNSQGLTLPGANPTLLSGGSYILIPNGAYFNGGGTAYFSNQSMHRGGVNNDQGTLTLTGSNNVVNSASSYLQVAGKYAIDGSDQYLRLNQQGSFTGGIYTPYALRADGPLEARGATSLQTATGSQFIARDQGNGDLFLGTATGMLPGYPYNHYPVLGTHAANFYMTVAGTYTGYWSTSGCNQVSDERMKTDIRDLGAGDYRETLASLDRIRSVNFRYKQEVEVARTRPDLLPEAPMHIGVIAQSLPPALVSKDATAGLGVKMGDMMGYLVATVRGVRAEASARSSGAEAELAGLRGKVEELERESAVKERALRDQAARLEALESRLRSLEVR